MQLSGNLNHHILYKYIKTFIYENNTRTLFLLLSAMIGCNDIDYEHSAMDSFSAYPIIGDQSIRIDLSKTPKFVYRMDRQHDYMLYI